MQISLTIFLIVVEKEDFLGEKEGFWREKFICISLDLFCQPYKFQKNLKINSFFVFLWPRVCPDRGSLSFADGF